MSTEEIWKEHHIEELPLWKGTILLLRQNNVRNLYQLFQKKENDFMRMRFVGKYGTERFFGRKELHQLLICIEKYQKIRLC